jgi:RNA polymerase sigma factor (TIGR02999 family)
MGCDEQRFFVGRVISLAFQTGTAEFILIRPARYGFLRIWPAGHPENFSISFRVDGNLVMPDLAAGEITQLLKDGRAGDSQIQAQLMALVYDQLYAMAHRVTGRQAAHHTLNPTALVNEAFVKLVATDTLTAAPDRRYFYAAAARAMRQILADHARKKNAAKRGGGRVRVALDQVLAYLDRQKIDALELSDSLDELERRYVRKAQVVQLRFFAGMTLDEVARHLGVSLGTVELDWRAARAFLKLRLQPP